MRRRSFLAMLPGALTVAVCDDQLPNRPKAPGTLLLLARSRTGQPPVPSEKQLRWEVAQTAIII